VLGWVFLNEQLGGRALAGFVLVLLSIIGVQRAMMPRASGSAPASERAQASASVSAPDSVMRQRSNRNHNE